MNSINLLKILQRYPLFTINDLAKLLQKSPKYLRTIIYRLKKRDLLFQIERGKYTVYQDPLLIASHIYQPSYLSLWTALNLYHLTEQLPKNIQVIVPKSKKQITFQNTKITFTKLNQFWGYKKEKYQDFYIFIAEKEKLIIDCLLSKKVPLDEIKNSLSSKEIELEKLTEYAKKTKNSSIIKRLGYLLELSGKKSTQLLGLIDNNYIPLEPSSKKTGQKNRKWKLIINRRISR